MFRVASSCQYNVTLLFGWRTLAELPLWRVQFVLFYKFLSLLQMFVVINVIRLLWLQMERRIIFNNGISFLLWADDPILTHRNVTKKAFFLLHDFWMTYSAAGMFSIIFGVYYHASCSSLTMCSQIWAPLTLWWRNQLFWEQIQCAMVVIQCDCITTELVADWMCFDNMFVWATHFVITMLDSSVARITRKPRMICDH